MTSLTSSDTRKFVWRVAMFYGALFIVYGVHVPFLPVWLKGRGLTPAEISIVIAAPFFVRCLITPAVAAFADEHRSHRLTLIFLAWTTLALIFVLERMTGFWGLLFPTIVMMIALSTIMPLIETIAVSGVRTAGVDYGRMRLWGSLTFVVASFIAGYAIDMRGTESAIWLLAAGMAITVAAAHLLPLPAHNATLALKPAASHDGKRVSRTRQLLTSKNFVLFLIAGGAVQSAHAMMLTLGAVHWQTQGYSGVWIGSLWIVAIAAEIVVFAYSGAIFKRFTCIHLIFAGCITSLFRWTVMGFDPPAALLVPLQLLHGLTYAAAHIGAIHFMREAIPDSASGRAQALYATIASGLAHGSAALLAGYLFTSFGGATYFAMTLIAAIGTLAAWKLMATWNSGLVVAELR